MGGQTPTLKNPPFVGTHPTSNLPTVFSVAGVSWAAFRDQDGYPTKYSAIADILHLSESAIQRTSIPSSQSWTSPKRAALPAE